MIYEPSWHQGPGEEGASLGPRHVHHGGRLHALLGALGHRLLSEHNYYWQIVWLFPGRQFSVILYLGPFFWCIFGPFSDYF